MSPQNKEQYAFKLFRRPLRLLRKRRGKGRRRSKRALAQARVRPGRKAVMRAFIAPISRCTFPEDAINEMIQILPVQKRTATTVYWSMLRRGEAAKA